ncbi:MAG: T9SS type A sorting domain-containing protein [Chitinophagaceae bacterium]|nr:T9SS type A sorting domain-containing protein [Chitinophagaceae bacterium]
MQPGEYHVYLNRNPGECSGYFNRGATAAGNVLAASVFPNPARSSSVLDLNMPETGNLKVELINASGQQLSTLFSQRLQKGNHQLPLVGKIENLSSGVYLLNIEAAGKKAVTRIIIK